MYLNGTAEETIRYGRFDETLKNYYCAAEGAFSLLTKSDIERKSITVNKYMRDMLIRWIGEENLLGSHGIDRQMIRSEICPSGEIWSEKHCEVAFKFTDPEKEMKLYLSSNWIEADPEEGDCLAIWFRGYSDEPVLSIIKKSDWNYIYYGLHNQLDQESYDCAISPEESMKYFLICPNFRQAIKTGRYTYTNPLYIVNSPKYFEVDEDGETRLTEYADEHLKESVILFAFDNSYKREDSTLMLRFIAPVCSVEPKVKGEPFRRDLKRHLDLVREEYNKVTEDLLHMPNNLPGALQFFRKKRKVTYREIAKGTGLHEDTVGKIIRGTHPADEKSLAKICFYLRLPAPITERIFNMSPNSLDLFDTEDRAIYWAIYNMSGQSLEAIRETLIHFDVHL